MRLGRWTLGFMWNCPWRLEGGRAFEYWTRYQCGPFYVLRAHRERRR